MSGIFHEVKGEGSPVILLHGFPMNQQVWKDFSSSISGTNKVYTPDLPGFGQSPLIADITIDSVAVELINWIKETGISKPVLIGHSLGGYVSLAMAAKAPDLFSGLGLFHSTAYADTPEKKESRTKTVEFIRKNGVLTFTSNFIQPLFANPDHPAIALVKNITIQSPEKTVISYTEAMRERPDRQNILKELPYPVLFIGGEKDKGIPTETLQKQAGLCRFPYLHILRNVGHMGMFESPSEASQIIQAFISRCQMG